MIRIYKNDCKNFDTNGLGILTDFKTSPKINESLNGNFELNFDYFFDGKNAEYLIIDNIIKTPYDNTEQLFRIKRVEPSLTKTNIIKVYTVHIFYDLAENFLTDVRPTKKNAVNAISYLLENSMFPHKFQVSGSSSSDNTAFYIKKNIVEAILGSDNCIVSRWGGDIERDNFNIIYHEHRGKDRGVYIKQGKNIKEIKITVDFTTVVTRIVPQGANGLSLPEVYIDSPIINTYRNPIVKTMEFNEVEENDEVTQEEACEKLRELAEQQFESGIDKPKISVSVNWLDLSRSEEYKEKYSIFEYVRLGDTVTVQALGYEYKIRVIAVEYDCLLNRYTKFEIGEPKNNFVTQQDKIVTEIQKNSTNLLEQARQYATTLINSGFGGHVRVYPDRILIMDTDNESTAKNVWQWNINGFGHSSTGINGDYETAITMDGQIVADKITAGTLDIQRINGLANALGEINTSIELNHSNIQSCVKQIDFDQSNQVLNANLELLKQQQTVLEQTATNITATISDIQANGVQTVKNTMVVIDIEGIKVSVNTDAFSSLLNNRGIFLYKYGSEIGRFTPEKTVLDNLTVRNYLVYGYHRKEKYNDEKYGKMTGTFYVGEVGD